MKINKQYHSGCSNTELCYIRINQLCAQINANSRDSLGDPTYVAIEYNDGNLIVSASQAESDYKLSRYGGGGRSFSIARLMSLTGKLEHKAKFFGRCENGKLIFKIKSEEVKQ